MRRPRDLREHLFRLYLSRLAIALMVIGAGLAVVALPQVGRRSGHKFDRGGLGRADFEGCLGPPSGLLEDASTLLRAGLRQIKTAAPPS
jgi:hypothetical protein